MRLFKSDRFLLNRNYFVLVMLAIFSFAVNAGTTCEISISHCPNHSTTIGTFADNYLSASSNQAECMQRANDYYGYCGLGLSSGLTVTADYLSNGKLVQENVVGKTGCLIVNNNCPNHPTFVGSFIDNYAAANANQALCSMRAEQYYDWCGSLPNQQSGRALMPITSSIYYQNGAVVQSTHYAFSGCLITQGNCPYHPTYIGSFIDSYLNANSNPNECMQRASDYYGWCGGAAAGMWETIAQFYQNGYISQFTTAPVGRPYGGGGG